MSSACKSAAGLPTLEAMINISNEAFATTQGSLKRNSKSNKPHTFLVRQTFACASMHFFDVSTDIDARRQADSDSVELHCSLERHQLDHVGTQPDQR